jgi:hypothetical protein
MSTPVSQLDIVNIALGNLKQRSISSMAEVSVQAEEANRAYEPCRKEVLRGHDWGFATNVKALALNVTYLASDTGLYAGKWQYAYVHPSNVVAVWHVYNESTTDKDNGEEFRIIYDDVNNEKVILTNCEDALGECTFDLQDTTLFDANFVTAFAYRLAANMAPNLTGDDSIAADMLKAYNLTIQEAERINSYEQKDMSALGRTSSYEDVR